MSDTYLDLVNSGPSAAVAKRLGLPRPARLRRTDPSSIDAPLTVGPVLVLSDDASRPDADTVASALLDWDLDVRRDTSLPEHKRWGAVVLVLTELPDPGRLGQPALELGSVLRRLAPGARIVTISRAPAGSTSRPHVSTPHVSVATRAARQAVDGFLRSVAKELRAGATGNGVLLADDVPVTAPSALGALRFLLSARSAFVDGQFVGVDTDAGELPADWRRPLAGQVAAVTGAARGIGAEIARVLTREGATVIGVDVTAAGQSLAAVVNEVRGSALQLDVTATDAGARIADHALTRHGRLDLVVHNAGITRDKLLANMTEDRWSQLMEVNLLAPLRITEAILDADLAHTPRVVALASTSGIAGNRGQTNYGASKAGVIGLVQALAPVLAERGATANAVAPGFIETEMTAKIPPVPRQVARRVSSLQQGGRPVDVAEAISFLASPQAGGINGQVLRVCGQNIVGQ